MDRRTFAGSALLSIGAARSWAASSEPDWTWYAGDAAATRYSPLDQIKRSNVARLKVAWTHSTEDAMQRPATTLECTPVVVDGVLYLTSPRLQVRALKAATGEALWNFNPFEGSRRAPGVCRGVIYHRGRRGARILVAMQDKIYAIDAKTGKLDSAFGDNGIVDLKQGFDRDMMDLSFRVTSPPVLFEDTLIVGGGGGEGPRPQAPGHIRGYDVFTGKRKWIFHTIPHPGEFGQDTGAKSPTRRMAEPTTGPA
jgi:quinoprotein glucose dehydrogenase